MEKHLEWISATFLTSNTSVTFAYNSIKMSTLKCRRLALACEAQSGAAFTGKCRDTSSLFYLVTTSGIIVSLGTREAALLVTYSWVSVYLEKKAGQRLKGTCFRIIFDRRDRASNISEPKIAVDVSIKQVRCLVEYNAYLTVRSRSRSNELTICQIYLTRARVTVSATFAMVGGGKMTPLLLKN